MIEIEEQLKKIPKRDACWGCDDTITDDYWEVRKISAGTPDQIMEYSGRKYPEKIGTPMGRYCDACFKAIELPWAWKRPDASERKQEFNRIHLRKYLEKI